MADFSWADGVKATFSSCLVCFPSSTADSDDEHLANTRRSHHPGLIDAIPPPRARPDELEGLLADADDADTISLHSNVGERRRERRRRPRKGITLFGYDLFGRPPIHLSDSEDEHDARDGRRDRTISSSTLDSDAAPLDPSAIDELSAARLAAATAAAEDERRRAKEERRALRRERKELKRVAMEMGLSLQKGEEFEGFQGSGGDVPYRSRTGPSSGSDSLPGSPFVNEEFGPFAGGPQAQDGDDADADHADFGAESYARRKPNGTSSGGGSDSRSRTSGSASNSNSNSNPVYNHHYISQPSPLGSPALPAQPKPQKHRSTTSRSRHSSRLSISSRSHSNSHSPSVLTPQSPMLPSPVGAFDNPGVATPPYLDEPHVDFDGVPGGGLRDEQLPAMAVSGFPSVGLRGPGMPRMKSDMGVFLARRGDE